MGVRHFGPVMTSTPGLPSPTFFRAHGRKAAIPAEGLWAGLHFISVSVSSFFLCRQQHLFWPLSDVVLQKVLGEDQDATHSSTGPRERYSYQWLSQPRLFWWLFLTCVDPTKQELYLLKTSHSSEAAWHHTFSCLLFYLQLRYFSDFRRYYQQIFHKEPTIIAITSSTC